MVYPLLEKLYLSFKNYTRVLLHLYYNSCELMSKFICKHYRDLILTGSVHLFNLLSADNEKSFKSLARAKKFARLGTRKKTAPFGTVFFLGSVFNFYLIGT